jgi:hypothetical protein
MTTTGPAKPRQQIQRSSSVSESALFVRPYPGTSTSPGSSEQTESPAQDRFRNASFISRSAILGDDFRDIDHAHAEKANQEDKVSQVTLKTLKLHGAFDLPGLPLRQSLIEAYAERCYTWMPVVDLSTLPGLSQGSDSSLLLLQAIVLVGSLMRPDVCSKAYCDRQYQVRAS